MESSDPPFNREELICALYQELRRRAILHVRDQPPGVSFGPTALTHSVILKLWNRTDSVWGSQESFVRQASAAMRTLLVDHARNRSRAKRNSCKEFLAADEVYKSYQQHSIDLVALDEALEAFKETSPVMAEAVVLHFFGGRDLKDVAQILNIPERTFRDQWKAAKAWLKRRMR
ncbi:MAG: sigma-70 family RNA polymerase sigma factor [Planctomycetes bacterium]|nr:sigma-70 family RNA polymerase sigma factor [Planctomycetota bacterium]